MRVSKRWQRPEGQVIAHPGLASTLFEAALDAFLTAQDAAGHSHETKADYKAVVGLFLRYMCETHKYTAIQQITEPDILGWLAHLRTATSSRGKPFSSRSIQTYCRDVTTFFHWLVGHNYLAVNPMANVSVPKVEKALIRVFTEDELKRLDAACDRAASGRSITPDERKMLAARDRAILWVLLSTGIRLSELCGLRFCDLEWEKGMILVKGKGAKERKVPVGSIARQHLNTYITYWRGASHDSSEAVFLSVFGRSLTPGTVKQMFARLKRNAGITDKRVSAHTCRHWFAVNCIKRGMPTVALRDLLGHETWDMIEVYVRLAEQDKRELYIKFSPVDALDMHHTVKGRRERAREWRNARKRKSE